MLPSSLPAGWSIRPTTAEDAETLLALVHASDVAAVGFADFDPEDVNEALRGPFSVVAVGPADEIMGWSYVENGPGGTRDFLEVYVHPEGGQPSQRPLLGQALSFVHSRYPQVTMARAGAIPTELAWIDSLRDAGFGFLKQYARMTIDLPTQPIPLAPDVHVRPVEQDELEEFFQVFDTAFRDTPDYQPTSYARWRERFVDGPHVSWDEWLVALVDGQIVGILQSSEPVDAQEGWVKHLAVLGTHRKRGVGRALLSTAFDIYAAKGKPAAGLGVDLANPTEAIRLYLGVGMRPAYQANIYQRAIDGPSE